jgi:hypothetical protein
MVRRDLCRGIGVSKYIVVRWSGLNPSSAWSSLAKLVMNRPAAAVSRSQGYLPTIRRDQPVATNFASATLFQNRDESVLEPVIAGTTPKMILPHKTSQLRGQNANRHLHPQP